MVIDRKRGQNVWRETWAGGKLMEGETYAGGEREREDSRNVQYGERGEKREGKMSCYRQSGTGKMHVFKGRHN